MSGRRAAAAAVAVTSGHEMRGVHCKTRSMPHEHTQNKDNMHMTKLKPRPTHVLYHDSHITSVAAPGDAGPLQASHVARATPLRA